MISVPLPRGMRSDKEVVHESLNMISCFVFGGDWSFQYLDYAYSAYMYYRSTILKLCYRKIHRTLPIEQ